MSRGDKKKDWDLDLLLSVDGFSRDIVRTLARSLRDRGGTIDDLRRLLNEPELALKMADILVGKTSSSFSALVTYVQPSYAKLQQIFNWVNSDFSKANFKPIERCRDVSRETREISFECVHLNRDASADEVLAEMDRQGLRPALYQELLAFGAKYPDEQRQFPIVALGSVWRDFNGCLGIACLDRNDSKRSLHLDGFGGGWGGGCRFLAVRETTAEKSRAPAVDPSKPVIDTDTIPFIPEGLSVVAHRKMGQLVWDPAKTDLFYTRNQIEAWFTRGDELQRLLEDKPTLNATVLDFLLAHPQFIPETWKGKNVYFWGTLFRGVEGNVSVRGLRWDGEKPGRISGGLYTDYYSDMPAAVLVK